MTTAEQLVATMERTAEEMLERMLAGASPKSWQEENPLVADVGLALAKSKSPGIARYMADLAKVGYRAAEAAEHRDEDSVVHYAALLVGTMAHLLATGYGVRESEELERMVNL